MPLSDDEFNELLQKRLNATEDESALEGELLSEEDEADLAIMSKALGNYKAESLAWAEKRSSTLPPLQARADASFWHHAQGWGLTGAALAACAVAAAALHHGNGHAPAVAVVAPTAQALAADNQLLSSVDAALARGASVPTEQELGLSSTDLLTGVHDMQRHGSTRNATN